MLSQNPDTSYNHTKQHGPIPVDLNSRCVVAEEIENRGGHDSVRPLKWKCTSECRMLTGGEIEVVLETKFLFQKCIDDVRAGLDSLDSGCSCVCHDRNSHIGFVPYHEIIKNAICV